MLKNVIMTIGVLAVSATLCAAQSRPADAKAPAKPAADTAKAESAPAQKAPPEPAPLPINIKIEVSITDQTGTNTPAKKVVTMIASDRMSTNVRSSASVPVKQMLQVPSGNASAPPTSYTYRNVTINVDARPSIVQKEPNKISLNFGLEYIPRPEGRQEEMEPGMGSWSERLSLILESGKPMVISQAADPTSDRKITVEVTATILK
jgi:hypothetical protein